MCVFPCMTMLLQTCSTGIPVKSYYAIPGVLIGLTYRDAVVATTTVVRVDRANRGGHVQGSGFQTIL